MPAADPEHAPKNMWVGQEMRRDAMRRAVVRQGAIFPYHFVTGSSQLTPLGERELSTLAEHLRGHGGRLSVRRGSESEELYAERRAVVHDALVARGFDEPSIVLDDALPGGDGASSERAIRASDATAAQSTQSSGTSEMTTGGSKP